ncbi:MAG TPA: GGDEF domain-containing protein [Terracidiphilus sp.]|jgi:diguanylate cyclase (GGDEF)-like protein
MPKLTPALPPTEPDPAMLDRLALVERIALATAGFLFLLNLAGCAVLLAGVSFPGVSHLMNPEAALAGLLCAVNLQYSAPQYSKSVRRMALLLAAAVAVACGAMVCEHFNQITLGVDLPTAAAHGIGPLLSQRMSVEAAGAFALLALSLLAIPARQKAAVIFADLLIFCLVLLVLVLTSGYVIGILGVVGTGGSVIASSLTVLGLLLLTTVAFLRKARTGMFSILLGHGIGSNIVRGLAPLLLALPYLRECLRARFIGVTRMPPHYTTALLASLAVMISFGLLLFLAWRINAMELQIHELSLRDALTDLYNLRGFRLLAEQALRMARRSNLPFSVLFIDLDGLKLTNDSLGHQAGSQLLIETGRILKSSFRESDVMGRIGGDEFAVAGQFNQTGIALAAQRIGEGATRRNSEPGHEAALSFSAGYVTAEFVTDQSLDELLAQADRAMYEDKRRKKVAVS